MIKKKPNWKKLANQRKAKYESRKKQYHESKMQSAREFDPLVDPMTIRHDTSIPPSVRAEFDNRPEFDLANEIYDNTEGTKWDKGFPRPNADGFIPGFGSVYTDLSNTDTYIEDRKKTGLYKPPSWLIIDESW
tara:strand:- start:542 stop:940 length:399 start_codon:yes stop_codon:yes gene_type:complete